MQNQQSANRYQPASEFACARERARLLAARQGDRQAMQEIYQAYVNAAYNLALRLLNNSAEAEDVVQDAFIKCFRSLHQYRAEASFWAWFRTIVSSTALMRLRARKSESDIDKLQLVSSAFTSSQTQATPVTTLTEYDITPDAGDDGSEYTQQQQLLSAIQRLPDLTRAVVWLYYIEGYSHKEIAKQMKKSVSFSKTRVARGNQQLVQWLNPTARNPHAQANQATAKTNNAATKLAVNASIQQASEAG